MSHAVEEWSNFLSTSLGRVIEYSFSDPHLNSEERRLNLNLEVKDRESLEKFRVSSISMILYLNGRAVIDAAKMKFSSSLSRDADLQFAVERAANLADAIAEGNRRLHIFPSYVDSSYFSKWRRRYDERARDRGIETLRQSAIFTCYGQCTFSYGDEVVVDASKERLLNQLEVVYDNYVIGLRKFLGTAVLR